MIKHDYSEQEQNDRAALTDVKISLLRQYQTIRNHAGLVQLQIRNVDRCQDAWTTEMLFRRGIPLAQANTTDFGERSMEVNDEPT